MKASVVSRASLVFVAIHAAGAVNAAPSIKSSKLCFIHSAVRVIFLLCLGEAFWSVKFTEIIRVEVPHLVDPCEAVL